MILKWILKIWIVNGSGLGAVLTSCVGRAMAQAVSRQPLTADTRVRAWVNTCGICCGQSGTGTGFSPSSPTFPVNIVPPWLTILTYPLGDEQ
jgi:hypothetical protein